MIRFVIDVVTDWLRRLCSRLPRRPRLVMPLSFEGGFLMVGERQMVTLTDVQKVTVGPISGTDAKGNVAPLDGAPTFAVSDPTLATLAVSADGLSCDVVAAGALGTFQLTVSADGKIGPEVKTIMGTVDFTVIGSDAVSLVVPVAAPVEQ